MVIEDRTLAGVETLAARYRKEEHRCDVERGEDGTLAFVLVDGQTFKSPSAAGSAVMGGIACNGWRFWTPLDQDGATTAAPATRAAAPAVAPPKRVAKTIRRVPNQRGVAAGQTRWFCAACMDGFLAPDGETPAACPLGHSNAA